MLADDLVIGQLTKRVRIEKKVNTPDGAGGFTVTWAVRDVVWAAVEPISSREAIQAGAQSGTLLSAITIWYRADVTITDRLILGARTFQIQSYQDPTGNQVALRLLCIEVQA